MGLFWISVGNVTVVITLQGQLFKYLFDCVEYGGRGERLKTEGGLKNFLTTKKVPNREFAVHLSYWTFMLLSIDTVKTWSSMMSITRPYCGLKHWVLNRVAGSYGRATKGKRGLVPCHTFFLPYFFCCAQTN